MRRREGLTVFPPSFFVGAATSGHQVEGNNLNSDCWALEHAPDSPFPESSGDAADFYHRWPEDVLLAADLGLQAVRFSLEWARIEPAPGEISIAELDHYRRIAAACRDAGLATVVTFNHWTTPLWFANDGGWENPASVDSFTRFADAAAAHLAGEVDWALTLNEPNITRVLAAQGAAPTLNEPNIARVLAAQGAAPTPKEPNTATVLAAQGTALTVGRVGNPGRFRPMMMWEGDDLARYGEAHRRARQAIRAHLDAPTGWTLACEDYQPLPGFEDEMAARRAAALTDWLELSRDDDFVGVQNYTRRLVGSGGVQPVPSGAPVNDLGWELHPPSLANAVRYAAEVTRRPVVVTEHGVATGDDAVRLEHTKRSLRLLAEAVAEGIDVRGYLHWTLLDEFEWSSGYSVTFGLVEVDRQTFERSPRPSARWLGTVCGAAT